MTVTELDLARAWEALRGVYDPELALDLVSLGLVYDVRAEGDPIEGDRIVVEMTLTTPGCPVSESLPAQAAEAVAAALGPEAAGRVDVALVWEPAWTPDRMEPEAVARLRGGRRAAAPVATGPVADCEPRPRTSRLSLRRRRS